MTNISDLNSAIQSIVGEIRHGKFDETTVVSIAEEFELNPKLLVRKFEEKYGCHPSEFKTADTQAVSIEAATRKAKEIAAKYTGGVDICGKVFTTDSGRHGVAAVYAKDGLHFVRVDSLEHWIVKIDRRLVIEYLNNKRLIGIE